MSRTLPESQQSLDEICVKLRQETLEPAKKEAEALLAQAHAKADSIVRHAEAHAEKIVAEARAQGEKERQVFQANLQQASKQALEMLRQKIELDLFHPHLVEVVEKNSTDPKVLSTLVEKIGEAIEKEGIETQLQVLIPKTISAEEFSKYLSKGLLEKLGKNGVVLGNFSGGIQVRLLNKKISLDLTAETLTQLLGQYVRKDFRELFFKKEIG